MFNQFLNGVGQQLLLFANITYANVLGLLLKVMLEYISSLKNILQIRIGSLKQS